MITVRYLRPKEQPREWKHLLLLDTDKIVISSFEFKLDAPFSPLGKPLIRNGDKGILFDHFEKWYNVLEVRDYQGRLKGYYSDIRTPPVRVENGYEALDLILDLWVYTHGNYEVLDENEFEQTILPKNLRDAALSTLNILIDKIENKVYPPFWVKDIYDEVHSKPSST